ncbi:hypothetical protein SASPL_129972 [Salvia splendens]|uniref:Disease resistance R13L4/SHOC-2-like LRR domain-containing protein n=1 Tax=Salvia splendens TaxID=180675 RepID=A0A8X8ZJ74_SALSN|nr:hypothetical protein SASPL_129972 [Salvia splendens]
MGMVDPLIILVIVLSILGGLKKLKALDMYLNFLVEMPDIITEMGFPKLDVLCINEMLNLRKIQIGEGGGYLDNASSSYWESFELLKILDMEDFGVKTLSDSIGTLIELSYLGLRNNYIQQIPHSIVGLKKLEVLDIAVNLHMSDVICQKPLKVDALQYLRTLTYISIYDWTYEASGLKKMTKLPKLGIEEVDEDSDVGKLFASLAMFSSYFRHLNLRGRVGEPMVHAEALHISELWNLRKIHVGKGVMPALEQLEIKHCPHLDSLPEDIGSMVKLTKFKMVTTKHIATKVRDSGLTSNTLDVDIIP